MVHPQFGLQGLSIPHIRNYIRAMFSQMIMDQKNLDAAVCSLLSKMNEIYVTLTKAELRDIHSMKGVVERISQQTLECSYFIQEYAQNEKFRKSIILGHVGMNLTLGIRNKVPQKSSFRNGQVCADLYRSP